MPYSARLLLRGGLALGALLSTGWLASCSSGSASSGASAPTITVSVSGAATTRLGATTQFTATVTGTTDKSVSWQVNGVTGGSVATGTISGGLYTGPATMPAAQSVAVSAVSVASPSATGSLTESLYNPIPTLASATGTQIGSSLSYLVDVTGTGFVPTSAIQAAGAAQATTYLSATELTASVTVPSGTTNINVAVDNPAPGAMNSSTLNIAITYYTTTTAAAARLLDQSSFGPTAASIQQVQSMGMDAYLNAQFAMPSTTMAPIPTNPLPAVCLSANNPYVCAESEWWTIAITGPDQLRQRVAFALSEMFVVSTQTVPGNSIPQFHNVLANDAFGNFYAIMNDVALTPAMGDYLNMIDSGIPAAGQIANENFARENMQLFSIGLNLLNQDGSEQLDGSGNPIPAYSQAQVQAFALAYTGWTFSTATGGRPAKFPNTTSNWNYPMAAVESGHVMTSKTLLNGTVLPAGQTAEQDMAGALDNLFNHPNAGPFVCKQLIQHLVTSTPSPAYISRVATVFANDGTGVRGNMQAVIKAILLDQEARAGDTNSSYDSGHLREPILFITAMMRGLAFTNSDVNGSYFALSNQTSKLSQEPYRANSVFNFFSPEYVIPGTTINAPEFGIENTATSILELSLADSIVNNKINSFKVDLSATSTLGTMAANPTTLANYLSMLFMHSQMPSNIQSTIISTITPLTNNAQRARVATYLVISSSQYKIIH